MRKQWVFALLMMAPGVVFAQGEAVVSGDTDHAKVLRTLGIQGIASAQIAAPGGGNFQTDILGIRYWFSDRIGLEAGFGIALANANNNTAVGFGFGGGVPIMLTVHKHITTFIEPYADFFIYSPGGNADTAFLMHLRGDIGFEWQLGFLETHTLGLIFKVGPGLQIFSRGNTAVGFATSGSSAVGTLSAAGGLVFYL